MKSYYQNLLHIQIRFLISFGVIIPVKNGDKTSWNRNELRYHSYNVLNLTSTGVHAQLILLVPLALVIELARLSADIIKGA